MLPAKETKNDDDKTIFSSFEESKPAHSDFQSDDNGDLSRKTIRAGTRNFL